jgi:prepilin-type N-terminal cleavage/methylation domain-containing protein
MRRPAFTLVEMLVVVGLLALVAALLLPSASRAREWARGVQCLSILQQTVAATAPGAPDPWVLH